MCMPVQHSSFFLENTKLLQDTVYSNMPLNNLVRRGAVRRRLRRDHSARHVLAAGQETGRGGSAEQRGQPARAAVRRLDLAVGHRHRLGARGHRHRVVPRVVGGNVPFPRHHRSAVRSTTGGVLLSDRRGKIMKCAPCTEVRHRWLECSFGAPSLGPTGRHDRHDIHASATGTTATTGTIGTTSSTTGAIGTTSSSSTTTGAIGTTSR